MEFVILKHRSGAIRKIKASVYNKEINKKAWSDRGFLPLDPKALKDVSVKKKELKEEAGK